MHGSVSLQLFMLVLIFLRSNLTRLYGFQLLVLLAAIAHGSLLLHLYHKHNKSSAFEVKFRQDSNHCKRVLEVAKLANIKRFYHFPKTWLLFLTNINLLHYLFNGPEVLSFAPEKKKQNCLLKNFLMVSALFHI